MHLALFVLTKDNWTYWRRKNGTGYDAILMYCIMHLSKDRRKKVIKYWDRD